MFAVVSYQGNQTKVEAGKEYKMDITESDDKKITFDEVLLISDGEEIKVGAPFIEGAKVEAEVIASGRGEKVSGIKFKAKKRYKRTFGHRQQYQLVKILSINA
ncbi:MAG: 50S ribosomal protein L21 [Patescibacteria group bacterium]